MEHLKYRQVRIPSLREERDVLVRLSESEEVEPASTTLWLHYYLAQHYDYLGQTEKAFTFIDQAIQDTPTLVELYMFKAKILKVGSMHSSY